MVVGMRSIALLAVAALACAAVPSPAGGAHGVRAVVTPTSVGPLRVGVAQPSDVVRFAGRPDFAASHFRGYDCGKFLCGTGFIFAPLGSRYGRLAAAWFKTPRYSTAHGTRPGSSAARALRVETDARRVRMCGLPALILTEPTAPGYPVLYVVFGVGRERGNVIELLLIDLDAPNHCIGHGHVYFDDVG